MKKLFTFLLLLFSFTAATAQQLVIDSTRFITGYECCTNIEYTIPTADKGILFVGVEGGNPGGIIPSFLLDTTNQNVFVGKIDSNQQISWLKVYGGSRDDEALSACQTPDGGYAILATTYSDNGNITNAIGDSVNTQNPNIWLLRLDVSGNLLWQKNYGSTESDIAISISNTPDHGFILLGATNGSDVDVPFHYGGFFSLDWLVVKTDSLGNKQWSKDLGTTGNEDVAGSILSIDSAYYLVSASDSNNHDCTDIAWHAGVYTGSDIYVLKLDTAGNVLWDSSYGGSYGEGASYAMFDTKDSSIMVTGYTYSDNYMVTGYKGAGDIWVLKLNKNGTLIWQKTLGDSATQDGGNGICIRNEGGYIVYGSIFEGPIGQQDCWIFYIDSAGNEITNKIFGGTDYDVSASVIPYRNGYVATGESISDSFTEGINDGRLCQYGAAFLSYINYWPLSTPNTIKESDNLVIYPNPSQGGARIILPANGSGYLSILNTIGQVVYTTTIKQGQQYIDVNTGNWAQGLYIVKWQGADKNVLVARMVNN